MKKCRSYIAISLAIALIIGGITIQTWAGEKGKFRGRAVLYTPKYTENKVLDTPEHIVYQGEQDGMIFNESGGKFLDNSRYQVVFKGEAIKGSAKNEGYKTFTMPDGSQVFAKFVGEGSGTHFGGTWTLIGGTGKYQGVKGQGKWDLTTIADSPVSWDILEGEYELP